MSEQEAFLRRECGEDEELFQDVLALVRRDSPSAAGTGHAGLRPARPAGSPRRNRPLPHRRPAWAKAVSEKSSKPEQTEPFQRRVAIKVVKAGMDTKAVLARFDAERQVLALLNHPSIAKVYDAGETGKGRSYFVMELVKGEPITSFCDRLGLDLTARLELFVDVCDAIRHAHQKGIIHRDLKPSNVLVSEEDGRPMPKVIDFGIAKATGHALTQDTLYTEGRPARRHAGIHESGTGRVGRRGRRHPDRRLFPRGSSSTNSSRERSPSTHRSCAPLASTAFSRSSAMKSPKRPSAPAG